MSLPLWNLRAVVWLRFPISSLVFLPGPVTLFVLSVFLLVVHSTEFFFEKILEHVLLRVRLFCVALVEHLGDDSW